jgi:EAL domain-containing protein (putative c-di-GMP-specific phosphodiesterase class I)
MDSVAEAKHKLGADLHKALEHQSLDVYYQPIVRIDDHSLHGFEALVRWPHPSVGLISPNVFVPLAEEIGLAPVLDHFVLETACHQLSTWRQAAPHLGDLEINVNVSSDQFLKRNLAQKVEKVLNQNDLDPRYLNLEIMESVSLHPAAEIDRVFSDLLRVGVGLYLDDFGTGYGSLAYLRQFPATGLKIDRSFIQDIDTNPKGLIVVESLIALAAKLGMRLVAEGIEADAHLTHLQQLGCEFGQGFLFNKPLTAEQVGALIV